MLQIVIKPPYLKQNLHSPRRLMFYIYILCNKVFSQLNLGEKMKIGLMQKIAVFIIGSLPTLALAGDSSPASALEMAKLYRAKLTTFQNEMMNSRYSPAEKTLRAQDYLNYAKREIESQTGGSGIIYDTLINWQANISFKVKQKQFSEAASESELTASKVLQLFQAKE